MEFESSLSQAEREKAFSAEKNVAFARIFVVPFNTILFLFMDESLIIEWLAYSITIIAWIYSFYFYFFEPYKKYPVFLTSYFSSLSDALLITFWLYSTGGFLSPFYPLWFISIIAIAFRFNRKITFITCFFYSLCYLSLLLINNEISNHAVEIVNRIGYIFLIGFVGTLITKETFEKTKEKVLMENLAKEAQVAQEELKKNEDLLKEAQSIANLGSWEWDVEKNVITWSTELYKIFGLEQGKVIGYEEYMELLHPEDRKRSHAVIEHSIKTLKPYSFEHRVIKNGEVRIIQSRGKVIADEKKKSIKLLGTALDITEIRNTKEELKLRDEFIGIASHELKTPLTSVKAYIQLIERQVEKVDEVSLGFIKKANDHINRLNNLISDLLDVSKIQGGKLQFNISEFDFDQMIKEGVEGVQHTVSSHKIFIDGRANTKVKGDKHRLEQVLINFLTNAVKYSPEANKVEVKVEKKDDEIIVGVRDYGVGISKKDIRKVFTKFYRVKDISHKFSGLGIGLFISAEIINRHEGKIWVESEEEKGSTFYFSIKTV